MTVAVGIDVSAIPAEPRGAGRYVVELVRALQSRGAVDLHLEARRSDGPRWAAIAPDADVRAVVPDTRGRRLAWEQLAAPRFVDGWGIDVHHGPHYTTPEVAKVPKVVTVHDLTFFDHPEWHEKVKVSVFKRAIRVATRRADTIVCVSEPTARRLHELLDPQCPVVAIPHGIDHQLFRPAGDDDEDDAHLAVLGVRPPYLVFVGTLEPRKDLATLVAAFDKVAPSHPELQLVVAGGSGWRNEGFERAVASSPFADRLVRTGYVEDAVIPALLRRAEAAVYPALAEGFGLPALEALACGAPLVTTLGSVMAEVADGVAWLAPPGDADGLAAALADVLADADREERRRQGLAVAAAYTWDATAAAHEHVYAAVAEAKPRRR